MKNPTCLYIFYIYIIFHFHEFSSQYNWKNLVFFKFNLRVGYSKWDFKFCEVELVTRKKNLYKNLWVNNSKRDIILGKLDFVTPLCNSKIPNLTDKCAIKDANWRGWQKQSMRNQVNVTDVSLSRNYLLKPRLHLVLHFLCILVYILIWNI